MIVKRFLLLFVFFLAGLTAVSAQNLEEGFRNPPQEAGIRCWWWWLNSNVTKESITRDLEAMHEKGYSGAMIFDAGTELNWGPDENVPNGPMFSSPEWISLFQHALREGERLQLELGLSIQSGWNLGGPTVTLDQAAKQICWSETIIEGGQSIEMELPVPPHNYDYYKDICVLAFPTPDSMNREAISFLSAKTGSRELGGSAPDCRFLLSDVEGFEGEEDTRLREIRILKTRPDDPGILKWKAPAGRWTIMRFGYTPTMAHVATSSDNWKGHVIDYLSEEVFDQYWMEVVDPILQAAGKYAGSVLKNLETDSWECGGMNWSPGFDRIFKNYQGYDLIRYLPVVAGKIVENREVSNAFLADLRKTIAAAVSDHHYKSFAEHAASYGMGIQPESAGPHAAPIDGITNYKHSEIVMSEFWVPCPHRPNPENRYFVKQAASAAHIYGKQLVAAESFTSLKKPVWSDVLWRDQKPSMDHEFCSGLNLIFVHTFTNSPQEMGLPGQEYFAGTHMNPQVTWWPYADAFIDYMGRIQYLTQKGKFVGDVLYYYGDHVPNIARLKEDDPAGCLPGYDYDVTNEEVLLQLEVKNGQIVVPGGVHYRLLVLPDHRVLSLPALKKVRKLIRQGAAVAGPKPERLVSLSGGKRAQKKFHRLANRVWKNADEEKGTRLYGKGVLVWGVTAREYLKSEGVQPDFEVLSFDPNRPIDYIHYTIQGADYYFVSNQVAEPVQVDVAFRCTGKQPELWDPISGTISPLQAFRQRDERTIIPLELAPNQSQFIVFREELPANSKEAAPSNYPVYQSILEVSGPWSVNFTNPFGETKMLEMESLQDWITSPDPKIRFFSGSAEYRINFELEELDPARHYWLQLNRIGDVGIAAIELNGMALGQVWTPPFKTEVGPALKSGKNDLLITVVNNWHNFLIGERDLAKSERQTKTNIRIRPDWVLQSSGLLGPVQIISD